MEPRLFSHGNGSQTQADEPLILAFQWSHDFSAMVMDLKPKPMNPSYWRFNGATTFQPW